MFLTQRSLSASRHLPKLFSQYRMVSDYTVLEEDTLDVKASSAPLQRIKTDDLFHNR